MLISPFQYKNIYKAVLFLSRFIKITIQINKKLTYFAQKDVIIFNNKYTQIIQSQYLWTNINQQIKN